MMATRPYMTLSTLSAKDTEHVYPIVVYARLIKKNTVEFTAKDLRQFLQWLWHDYPRLKLKRKWDNGHTWHNTRTTTAQTASAKRHQRTAVRHHT